MLVRLALEHDRMFTILKAISCEPGFYRVDFEETFDVLGGYGFVAMDKAAAQMELEPGWNTWLATGKTVIPQPTGFAGACGAGLGRGEIR